MALMRLAADVREGGVTSQTLVASSLGSASARLDGPVNAVISTRDDAALADAAAIDARVAAGEDPGPLAGLPLLVKDNEDCAGLPTTYGSLLCQDAPPAERDCEAVARLRAAGAVVVGKTNLPEFALEGFTANRLFGDTHNPWALDWSPGGSSGGSGAALAMGLAPLATATDGGGSIRIPAAFCGLVGFKPTNGLIGRDPMPSWIDLSTKGSLATSVDDADVAVRRAPRPRRGRSHGAPIVGISRGGVAPAPAGDAEDGRPRAAARPIASLFEEAVAAMEVRRGCPRSGSIPRCPHKPTTTGSRWWVSRSSHGSAASGSSSSRTR